MIRDIAFNDDDIQYDEEISLYVNRKTLVKFLSLFSALLVDKSASFRVTKANYSVLFSRGKGDFRIDGKKIEVNIDEKNLKNMVHILSDIGIDRPFDANHIDFYFRTMRLNEYLVLTMKFSEGMFVKAGDTLSSLEKYRLS